MAETFDTVTADPGSGGANITGDTFTQDSVSKFVPACYLVYGAAGGPYERVDTATPLPVAIISGQTGITAGAGAVAANTPRVTHASDDPAVTALQLLDDTVFTDDAAYTPGTSKTLVIGAQCDASAPDSVDEGDAGALRMTADRALHVSLRDAAGNNRGVNVGSSGEVAVSQSGTWNVGTVTTLSTLTTITNAVTVAQATAANLNCTEASAASIKTAVEALDDTVYVDDADFTDGASKGILKFGLYQSTPQNITDGDVGPVQVTTEGYQIVRVNGSVTVASHAVTNAGTFAVQVDGAALTALQLIDNTIVVDDAAFTPATTSVSMAGFTFDDSSPDTVNEGDAGAARMSSRREIYTQLRDAAGNERGANVNASGAVSAVLTSEYADDADWTDGTSTHVLVGGLYQSTPQSITDGDVGPIQVDSNGFVIISGTFNEDTAHSTGAHGLHVLTVRTDTAAARSGTDGDYQPFITDDAGRLHVNVGALTPGTSSTSLGKAVDNAAGGTDTGVAMLVVRDDALTTLTPADSDYTTLRVNSTGSLWVQLGDQIAHDSADSGNPVKIGAKASTTAPTAVSNADRVNVWATLQGALVTTAPPITVDLNTGVSADVDAAVAANTGLRLMGWSARETAGAPAELAIVNAATGANAAKIAYIQLASDASSNQWFAPQGIAADSGLSIDWVSGAFDIVLYYTVLT